VAHPPRSPLVAFAIATIVVVSACSSTTSHAGAGPTTTSTTSTTAEPPSTVLISPTDAQAASPLRIPFTADHGALIVTAGPAPAGITGPRAAAIVSSLRGPLGGFPLKVTQAPLHGLVDLEAGNGAPAMRGESAWIVPFDYGILPGCPAEVPATLPASASGLKVAIVEGSRPDQIVIYEGAGAAVCSPNVTPIARTWAELSQNP
jgi:hypothetical protein